MKKRNIKKENEIIKNVVENVKKFYLWKCQGWDNYDRFMKNVFYEINEGVYDYWFWLHSEDCVHCVMGDFCNYMIGTFSGKNAKWFDGKVKKGVIAVEKKLLAAIRDADLVKYAYEHIDEIGNKEIQLHITNQMKERE